jgi:hypothetical protein
MTRPAEILVQKRMAETTARIRHQDIGLTPPRGRLICTVDRRKIGLKRLTSMPPSWSPPLAQSRVRLPRSTGRNLPLRASPVRSRCRSTLR